MCSELFILTLIQRQKICRYRWKKARIVYAAKFLCVDLWACCWSIYRIILTTRSAASRSISSSLTLLSPLSSICLVRTVNNHFPSRRHSCGNIWVSLRLEYLSWGFWMNLCACLSKMPRRFILVGPSVKICQMWIKFIF